MQRFQCAPFYRRAQISSVSLALIALSALAGPTRTCFALEAPEWFAKPIPPGIPDSNAIRISSADELLNQGESMPPGATLVLEPGTYKLSRPMVLREKKNVTFRSASGDPASVTLTGKGWDQGDEHDDLIHIGDCDGVTLSGLTFAECRSYGVKVEAEHGPRRISIYNCRFRNIGIRAIKGSAGQAPEVRATQGSVRFCNFENTRIPPSNWLFNGDYIAAIDMMALDGWTFTDNIFHNIKGRNGGGRAAIFIWVRSRNIIVEHNLIVDCDRGISFGNPGLSTANDPGAPLAYVSGGTIRNNFIAGGADCGIELWHVQGIRVLHNSIWRPEQNWNRGIRIGTGTTDSEIINNLVHGGIQVEGGNARTTNNLAGRITSLFSEPAAGDLSLRADSLDAIDKALVISGVPRDIRRLPRKGPPDLGAWEYGAIKEAWVAPMQKVHARFHGAPGSLIQIGDSITFSGAFWSPLREQPRNMAPDISDDYRLVRKYLRPETFGQKGPDFGNQGSTTAVWARENISGWMTHLNPEIAVIMFGSNDVHKMGLAEYESALRAVIESCKTNGTIPILTTPPPQHGKIAECAQFSKAVRRLALEHSTPLIDFHEEILRQRPNDWDGSQFKGDSSDTYGVLTLISRDGVHPSNPQHFSNDFSSDALNSNGYDLRNYLTIRSVANVIRDVLEH